MARTRKGISFVQPNIRALRWVAIIVPEQAGEFAISNPVDEGMTGMITVIDG